MTLLWGGSLDWNPSPTSLRLSLLTSRMGADVAYVNCLAPYKLSLNISHSHSSPELCGAA